DDNNQDEVSHNMTVSSEQAIRITNWHGQKYDFITAFVRKSCVLLNCGPYGNTFFPSQAVCGPRCVRNQTVVRAPGPLPKTDVRTPDPGCAAYRVRQGSRLRPHTDVRRLPATGAHSRL